MFVNTIDPILIQFWGIQIRYYGLIYAGSLLVTYFYLSWIAKRKELANFKENDVETFMTGFIIAIVLGARAFHVFVYNLPYYLQHIPEILMVWKGGLSFHGGLLFALVWIYYFTKKKKIGFLEMTDTLTLPVAFSLGLGRIANFINGELVGKVTTLPIGVLFAGHDGYRLPTQLFESAKNFVLFFGLLSISAIKDQFLKKHFPGALTAIALIFYSIARFFIEFFKESTTVILNLNTAQVLCVVTLIFGTYLLIIITQTHKKVREFEKRVH